MCTLGCKSHPSETGDFGTLGLWCCVRANDSVLEELKWSMGEGPSAGLAGLLFQIKI